MKTEPAIDTPSGPSSVPAGPVPASPVPAGPEELVRLARFGSLDAFEALLAAQVGLPWRTAFAITADVANAAWATAEGFALVLSPDVPPRWSAPERSRLYVLAATRAAALAVEPSPLVVPASAHQTGASLTRLPERWRSMLWLVDVEGLAIADAGTVIGVSAAAAEKLCARARAGWSRLIPISERDLAAGPVGSRPSPKLLASAPPVPFTISRLAADRWRAHQASGRTELGGGAGSVSEPAPPVSPRLADVSHKPLMTAAAALVGIGVIGASLVALLPNPRPSTGNSVAAPVSAAFPTDLGTGSVTSLPPLALGANPATSLASTPAPSAGSTTGVMVGPGTHSTPVSPPSGSGSPTVGTGLPVTVPGVGGSNPSTPLVQTDLGINLGPVKTGASVGLGTNSCLGLTVVSITVGCQSPTTSTGLLSLDLGSSLLGPVISGP
ncbi:MAG: RNA polymerase sigma factor [Acidimicrobiales bacterium]